MFSTDPVFVRSVVEAGVDGVVVDWERRGKHRRQAGADTQINADTADDLSRVRHGLRCRVLCRVNGWGPWAVADIERAVERGADEILLPMVRRSDEVDAALRVLGGRARLGILVETQEAVRQIDELVRRPLHRIYVGLNDLRIDRGGRCLFTPLVDGTVDRIAAAARRAGIPFGVAGLTAPTAGRPVPCRLLIAELSRVGASFTFLRRSFHADVAGRDPAVEVSAIHAAIGEAGVRSPARVASDHAELEAIVTMLSDDQAM